MNSEAKGALAVIIVIIVSLLLQTTILSSVSPKPEGVLTVTLVVAFLRGPLDGALCGFVGGLTEDALSGAGLGNFCLSYAMVGWLVGLISKRMNSSNPLVLLIFGMLGSLAQTLLFETLIFLFHLKPDAATAHLSSAWIVVQGLLSMMLLFFLRGWFLPEPIKSRSRDRIIHVVGTRG